jgi:hypothetical protein
MKAWMSLCCTLLLLPLAGCFPTTVHPLNEGTTEVKDPALLGTWTAKCEDFQPKTCKAVIKAGADTDLAIEYSNEHDGATLLKAREVQIGSNRFLDVSLDGLTAKQSDAIPLAVLAHMAPAHSIWKLTEAGNSFSVTPMNGKAVQKFAGTEIQILEGSNDDDTPLITSSSKDLAALIRAHQAELFTDDPMVWTRLPAQASTH